MIEILLVDDETYVTESLAKTIPWSELGVEAVHQAASADEAFAIMEEQDIDILITDIRMPERTGLELIEQAKERWPNLRAVLLTGYSDFEYAKQAIKLRAHDYLLKPVDDGAFIACLSEQIDALMDEWQRTEDMHKEMYDRRTEQPLLRKQLMHELLLGRQRSADYLTKALKQYEIDIAVDQSCIMLTVQLAGRFIAMDRDSSELIEYAVGNIAEEVFTAPYRVWHSSSPQEHGVIIIGLPEGSDDGWYDKERIKELCRSFQKQVSSYLKGEISIVVSNWIVFPQHVAQQYRQALTALYRIQIDEPQLVMMDDNQVKSTGVHMALEELYKPPTFIHLLEGGQWQAAQEKLQHVFNSDQQQQFTREQLYEAFIAISNGLIYVARKKGIDLHGIDPQGMNVWLDRSMILTASSLETWSKEMILLLSLQYDESDTHQKKHLIKQVQELVSNELGAETSVKLIADRVFLHPVYLSKVYKNETGESLGDYIIRTRMEKAVYMLKHTNKKIYEITTELGYQNPQYFSKIFKKFYGCTPNEYRDQ